MSDINDIEKYLYTRYTITLHDLLINEPTLLDDLTLSTSDRTKKFKDMFIAKWDIYEINAETVKMFKLIITNKFNTLKDYYEELISAYETKINMLDGKLTTITREDTEDNTQTYSGESSNYDLPRTNTAENKPSSKSNNSGNTNDNKNFNQTITTKGEENVISLKTQYMKMLRNIYYEFVNDFETCFLQLFY